MARVALALLVLLIAGCSKERMVHDLVRQALKDPESAKFEGATNVWGSRSGLVACGLVNAKNSFGGYVGAQPYMIWDSRLYLPSSDDQAEAISGCCSAVLRAAMSGAERVDSEAAPLCARIGEGALILDGRVY